MQIWSETRRLSDDSKPEPPTAVPKLYLRVLPIRSQMQVEAFEIGYYRRVDKSETDCQFPRPGELDSVPSWCDSEKR